MLSKISVSEDEEQQQHYIDNEIVPQDGPYLDLDPIPNQKPKWAENLIEAAGNDFGDPDDRTKMSSQYQNEYVALSHTNFLPTEWCNKLLEICYLMMNIDP